MATKTTPQPKSNSLLMLEEQFAYDVGKATGEDPRVILSQVQVEGAYAPGGTGGLNFLNLKSGTVSSLGGSQAGSTSAGFAQFSSLGQAESATIAEYKSPAIAPYLGGKTPQEQISRIAASPWDAGHYGGSGQSLTSTFARLFGTRPLTEPAMQANVATAGIGSDITKLLASGGNPFTAITSNLITGGKNPLSSGIDTVTGGLGGLGAKTFKAVTGFSFTQLIEMLAGGVLILLGLIIIVLGGRGTPAAQTRRAVGVVR